MEIQEVEITIGKNGQVEVAVRGVKGLACLEITRDLEKALGGNIILREMSPEALEDNPNQIDQTDQLRAGS
jgi:hypothetical protein